MPFPSSFFAKLLSSGEKPSFRAGFQRFQTAKKWRKKTIKCEREGKKSSPSYRFSPAQKKKKKSSLLILTRCLFSNTVQKVHAGRNVRWTQKALPMGEEAKRKIELIGVRQLQNLPHKAFILTVDPNQGVCWIFSCGFCGVQRRLNSTPHVKISFYFTTFSEDRISPEGVDVGAAPRKKGFPVLRPARKWWGWSS